jgi:hypothetical protein
MKPVSAPAAAESARRLETRIESLMELVRDCAGKAMMMTTTPAMRVSTGVSPAERGRRRKGGMELFSLFVDRSESPLLIRESAMDGSEAAHEGKVDGVPDVFFGFGPRRVRLEAEAERVDVSRKRRRDGRRARKSPESEPPASVNDV